MTLSLHAMTVTCSEVQTVAGFYESIFSAHAINHGDRIAIDLHGVGRLELVSGTHLKAAAAPSSDIRLCIMTYILRQPGEVRALMDAAASHGAEILKPARKSLFGSFSGTFRAPDGVIWKLAAATNKDTTDPEATPHPTETTAILGVKEPKVSKAFYTSLGMIVDRDYGNKYIDFRPTAGASRLCLMQTPALAKDVGASSEYIDASSATPTHLAATPLETERITSAAAAAGATVAAAPENFKHGDLAAITSPDGHQWRIADHLS